MAARAGDDGGGYPGGIGHSDIHERRGGLYGRATEPPSELTAASLERATRPPRPDGLAGGVVRDVEMTVVERSLEVGSGVYVDAWTYEGTVPGPILRATAGDRLRIHFENRTERPHNLHFHGAHSPLMDGWEPIPPGGSTVYEIEAGPVGLHPYHCHTAPLAEHISKGLYGMLIVDPPGGRTDAHEVALLLSGFPLDGVRNELVVWNGVAGYYWKFPLKVEAGVPVRAYVVNMLEFEPVASFHLHAQTFAVFPAGTGEAPAHHSDVVTFGQADRAMLEFRLPERGRYMFHPHQHYLAERGAMGWFSAV